MGKSRIDKPMNCPKCGIPIESHEAKPCLDETFMKFVMQWRFIVCGKIPDGPNKGKEYGDWFDQNGKEVCLGQLSFRPSSNIAQAMEGVQKWKDDPTPPEKLAEALFQSLDPPIFINIENRKWQYLVEDILYRIDALSLTRALIMWAMGKGE